jgi:energy-coupling factor transport system substrate-specific component
VEYFSTRTTGLSQTQNNTLLTSTGSFDTGRAITNAVTILLLGPAVLATLRRAARKVRIDTRG